VVGRGARSVTEGEGVAIPNDLSRSWTARPGASSQVRDSTSAERARVLLHARLMTMTRRFFHAASAVGLFAALLPACGGSGESTSEGGAPEGGSPGGTTTLTIMAGGEPRIVIVHAPPGAEGPTALVVNMHGSGSTAAQQEALTGMDAAADADGFVAAYPQGAITEGTGFAWNVPNEPLLGGGPVPAGAADDETFLAQAITSIALAYPIDPARIYATGFSGGARMASQLGCDEAQTFAAVAPVSGLRLPSPCTSQRLVPVVAFHGTTDPIDPYDGNGQAYWTSRAHRGCYSFTSSFRRAHSGTCRSASSE
jgi:polyhydroxybutyrate depolymerase